MRSTVGGHGSEAYHRREASHNDSGRSNVQVFYFGDVRARKKRVRLGVERWVRRGRRGALPVEQIAEARRVATGRGGVPSAGPAQVQLPVLAVTRISFWMDGDGLAAFRSSTGFLTVPAACLKVR
eukprot:CAMPEP_0196661200 /NCGR_PEP_ID=MMETSP1086-20130531/43203_1 /TAXON_ID=77921 /ORGANISM="Cyanoptyche  gloeocystis , Strain SAG4.97" /LENGTH=124 /DNA_ID=CAMNT_0041995989 /DNA_START=57 /DNA_END=431 /DNA_ORIENTATION=+